MHRRDYAIAQAYIVELREALGKRNKVVGLVKAILATNDYAEAKVDAIETVIEHV